MRIIIFFFKQNTAYEIRISDWSSDVCSSDLNAQGDLECDKNRGWARYLGQYTVQRQAHRQPGCSRHRRRGHHSCDGRAPRAAPLDRGAESDYRWPQGNQPARGAPAVGRDLFPHRPAGGAERPDLGLPVGRRTADAGDWRSEEHTSELQSLMRISYAVFCLKKKTHTKL